MNFIFYINNIWSCYYIFFINRFFFLNKINKNYKIKKTSNQLIINKNFIKFLNNKKKNIFIKKPFFFFFYNSIFWNIKKNYLFYLINNIIFFKNFLLNFIFINYKNTFKDGWVYIRGLFIIFFLDSIVTDDEPLWEPVEWSLVQTWILFIFIFAWIAENLITSRFGSYTGRDKRVWFAWYKTFWLIDFLYVISFGATSMFVIVPFYYELSYNISFLFSWWNWYNRVFFFKFIFLFNIIILLSNFLLINNRWLNWKKSLLFILIIIFFLSYILYTQFIITFFSYFTDSMWYQKTRFIDFIQLSHEPLKWGWGPSKRDHFTYHKVSTIFWFKNDTPFAGAFLMFNLFFFFSLFFLFFYWIILIRKTYTTKEISFTFLTYCVSSLKQFFYFFFLFFIFIFISFIVCYWRFPIEFLWIINYNSWIIHFFIIIKDYFSFLIYLFK